MVSIMFAVVDIDRDGKQTLLLSVVMVSIELSVG